MADKRSIKLIKKLKWVVVGVVLLVVVAVVLVIVNLNSIVRSGVQSAATASLGLEAKLDSASVSLLGGSVSLSGFGVASPAGFAAQRFMEVGRLGLQVGYSELRSDPIRVGNISVDKPRLVLEQKDLKLNLAAVLESIPPTETPWATPPKLIVGVITVKGAEVVIRPGFPGLAQEIVVALPDLTVEDIGTAEDALNGVAIKQVVLAVATEMARQAATSDKVPPELQALLSGDLAGIKARLGGVIKEQVDKARDQAQRQLDQTTGQVKDAAGRATDDAQKAVKEGLGGLLKKP